MRRPSCPWLLGLGCALTTSGLAPNTRADAGGGLAFAWRAPEGCPPASAVEAEIERLLGGPAGEHSSSDLHVQATVERGALWFVTLETASKTASGHRTIEAATCRGLANATALIVALMIDPDAVAARTGIAKGDETPPPSPSVPTARAPTPTPAEPGSEPGKASARETHGLLGVAAAGSLGVLPSPDVGGSASVGVVRPRWRGEARATYGLRRVQSDPLADAAGAYGRFSFVAGSLAGCMSFLWPGLEMGPCASAEVGVVRGQGVGASQTTSKPTPWIAVGAGGFLAIRANPWLYFPIHVDAVFPLWRPHYVFSNVPTPIFQSWFVGGRLTAGVELRF